LTNLDEILNENIRKKLHFKEVASKSFFFEKISVFEISILPS